MSRKILDKSAAMLMNSGLDEVVGHMLRMPSIYNQCSSRNMLG